MSPQLSLQLTPQSLRYSSCSFIAHRGVRAISEAIMTLAVARRFAVVYIQGERGSGKTHLAVYLAGVLQEQGQQARLVSGGDGARWFAEELPHAPIQHQEVVLVDDADIFVRSTDGTGIFADLIERVCVANGLVVLVGATPPGQISEDACIKSRIGACVSLFMEAPAELELDGLLHAIVRQRGLELNSAKRAFVLRRVPRTVSALAEYAERLERVGEAAALSTSFDVLAEAASVGVSGPRE